MRSRHNIGKRSLEEGSVEEQKIKKIKSDSFSGKRKQGEDFTDEQKTKKVRTEPFSGKRKRDDNNSKFSEKRFKQMSRPLHD